MSFSEWSQRYKKIKNKILIAPLDWGLGHAVRDIPLINELILNNYEVIIASSGSSGELLKQEFPKLKYYSLPSIEIKYSSGNKFLIKLIIQLPKFIGNIKKENKALRKILKKEKIDLIISDNRYGIYSKNIPSIFISHQIFLILPKRFKFFEKSINNIQKRYFRKFDKCLIPDFKGKHNLSGELSHKDNMSNFYRYIGIISKFNITNKPENSKYDILLILSGPEPQRTIFYKKLYPQIKKTGKTALIVSGKPEEEFNRKDDNIVTVNHLSREKLKQAILLSEIVITRAGYTSIMDFVSLRKKAILIPTPGQTEQLYLADHLADKNLFVFENQNKFDLISAINNLDNLNPDFSIFDDTQKELFINIIKNYFKT